MKYSIWTLLVAGLALLFAACGGSSPSSVDGGTDSDTDSDSDTDTDTDADTDTDSDADTDSDTDTEADELCDEYVVYFEECEMPEDDILAAEECCPVYFELFTFDFVNSYGDCVMEATCEELLDDLEAVTDECFGDYIIEEAEPSDSMDALVESICDHAANDCGEVDYQDCVDEFWTSDWAEDFVLFLVIKDEILDDIVDCIDELAQGQCEDVHWEGCLFQDLEDLDTCGA